MATTVTIPTPSIHWVLYPLLIGGLVFGLWLWHDTKIKDAATLKEVAAAKTAVVASDHSATAVETTAQQDLQKQNAALETQLAKAKTLAQQIALLNQQLNTHVAIQASPPPESGQPPQAVNPSPVVVIPAAELPELTKQAVDFKEAQNQIAVDKLSLAAKDQQIASRDEFIRTQNIEITQLKGGSHLKRFLKATEYVVIGVAAGTITGYAIHK